MSNVITLPGVGRVEPEEPPGAPEPELIQMLSDLLERFKSGELTSVAFCAVHRGGNLLTNDWFIGVGQSHLLAAAIGDLQHQHAVERNDLAIVVQA